MAAAALRPALKADLDWIVARHQHLYSREWGWDATFGELVQDIIDEFAARAESKQEAVWIAEIDATPVGCVMCAAHDGAVAKLRLLLVEPEHRGAGVGELLISRCVSFARDAGYKRVQLWTTDNLAAARRLYDQAGFQLIASEPMRRFGHELTEQTMELAL